MTKVIYFLAEIINDVHDLLGRLIHFFFPSFSDKDMHFWIIGIFGIVFYFLVNVIFRKLAKLSIELISFIYTSTVLIVVVFAIEIQQRITNRGVMDFEDVVAGLLGFVTLYGVYLVIKLLSYIVKIIYKRLFKKKTPAIEDEKLSQLIKADNLNSLSDPIEKSNENS